MATALDLFPARVRFVDEKGLLTPAAIKALGLLQVRVGGPVGPSTTDLAVSDDDDSGLEELKAEFAKSLDGLGMQPQAEAIAFVDLLIPPFEPVLFIDPLLPAVQESARIEALETEIASLREAIAVLTQQITGLQQGADA